MPAAKPYSYTGHRSIEAYENNWQKQSLIIKRIILSLQSILEASEMYYAL